MHSSAREEREQRWELQVPAFFADGGMNNKFAQVKSSSLRLIIVDGEIMYLRYSSHLPN